MNGRSTMLCIDRFANPDRLAFDLSMVLDQNPVLDHGHVCRGLQGSIPVEARCFPDNILVLPLTRFLAGIGKGDDLLVY